MSQWPKPAEGSWTQHYPDLGTSMISFEDSVSPEFFELEREAIFKRAWLNVGRIEQLSRTGSYFTKEIEAARPAGIVVRDPEGEIKSIHKLFRHPRAPTLKFIAAHP